MQRIARYRILAKDRNLISVVMSYLIPVFKRLADSLCTTVGSYAADNKSLSDRRESTAMTQFCKLAECEVT